MGGREGHPKRCHSTPCYSQPTPAHTTPRHAPQDTHARTHQSWTSSPHVCGLLCDLLPTHTLILECGWGGGHFQSQGAWTGAGAGAGACRGTIWARPLRNNNNIAGAENLMENIAARAGGPGAAAAPEAGAAAAAAAGPGAAGKGMRRVRARARVRGRGHGQGYGTADDDRRAAAGTAPGGLRLRMGEPAGSGGAQGRWVHVLWLSLSARRGGGAAWRTCQLGDARALWLEMRDTTFRRNGAARNRARPGDVTTVRRHGGSERRFQGGPYT
jgi:hypothetical protein